MRRFTGIFILIATIGQSCQNKAVEYNNQLVKIQQEVLPRVQEFAKKWSGNVDSSNLSKIVPEAAMVVELLNQKIAQVNLLAIVKDGEILKNAIIDQLEFQKQQCYKLGRLADSTVPAKEKASIEQELINNAPDADKITRKITETQKDYAKNNHFTLQNK